MRGRGRVFGRSLRVTHTPVLIIIPCLNEERHIARVLASLRQDLGAGSLVVVADGGSTDRTRAIVSALSADDPQVILLHNVARLQSAGVNAAAAKFGDPFTWMIRVDAHADYPVGFVARLIEEAEATGADSVVTALRTTGTSCFTRAAAAAQNSRLGTGGAPHRARARSRWIDHGHHSLFRLSVFRRAGGYDPEFSHNEDAELDLRLGRLGARIWLTTKTYVVYHPRSTAVALARQYRNHGAGRARTLRKHRVPPRPRQLGPALIAPALLLSLLSPLSAAFAAPVVIWASVCALGGLALAIRARDVCAAASGVAAMIMQAAWSFGFWSVMLRRTPTQYSFRSASPA